MELVRAREEVGKADRHERGQRRAPALAIAQTAHTALPATRIAGK